MVEGDGILEVIQDSPFCAEAQMQTEVKRTTGNRQKRSPLAEGRVEMKTGEEAYHNLGKSANDHIISLFL